MPTQPLDLRRRIAASRIARFTRKVIPERSTSTLVRKMSDTFSHGRMSTMRYDLRNCCSATDRDLVPHTFT